MRPHWSLAAALLLAAAGTAETPAEQAQRRLEQELARPPAGSRTEAPATARVEQLQEDRSAALPRDTSRPAREERPPTGERPMGVEQNVQR